MCINILSLLSTTPPTTTFFIYKYIYIVVLKRKAVKIMSTILIEYYLWIKAAHIISVICWMVGLFYLPRLFVYHVETSDIKSVQYNTFLIMEMKLLHYIMKPALIASWIFGILLVFTPGVIDWGLYWPWIKLMSLVILTYYHFYLNITYKNFLNLNNVKTGRYFRFLNEVPTILLIIIVLSVIIKPF